MTKPNRIYIESFSLSHIQCSVVKKHYGLLFAIELSLENNQLVYTKEFFLKPTNSFPIPSFSFHSNNKIKISLDGYEMAFNHIERRTNKLFSSIFSLCSTMALAILFVWSKMMMMRIISVYCNCRAIRERQFVSLVLNFMLYHCSQLNRTFNQRAQ